MSYKSILVNLDIEAPSEAALKAATGLAREFEAMLVGFAAADLPMPIVTTEGMVVDGGFIEDQREDIERQLAEARAAFDRSAAGLARAEWRGGVYNPSRLLMETARLCDLVVTAAPSANGDDANAIDVAEVALHAGRPVLVLADNAGRGLTGKALVAWKDTREARRAVADAVPLLARASEVIVATVDRDASEFSAESLADVALYLSAHGIKARTEVLSEGDDAGALIGYAEALDVDLIVSGAFGHSRLREWVFGGVTRSLLNDKRFNRFVSS
ncbi:MAG: universal stress protein [Rhizobiaceae bacterium]|nr:universal stress protein [Rhizobiaceae bacterium]